MVENFLENDVLRSSSSTSVNTDQTKEDLSDEMLGIIRGDQSSLVQRMQKEYEIAQKIRDQGLLPGAGGKYKYFSFYGNGVYLYQPFLPQWNNHFFVEKDGKLFENTVFWKKGAREKDQLYSVTPLCDGNYFQCEFKEVDDGKVIEKTISLTRYFDSNLKKVKYADIEDEISQWDKTKSKFQDRYVKYNIEKREDETIVTIGDKTETFSGYSSVFQRGKCIVHFINGDDADLYNDEFKNLGSIKRFIDDYLFVVEKTEGDTKKYYCYNCNGEQICEVSGSQTEEYRPLNNRPRLIKKDYKPEECLVRKYEDHGTPHYIIRDVKGEYLDVRDLRYT